MAGLLVCGNFGPTLRADDAPLVITASGGPQKAAAASRDNAPGVQFHENDSDSKASRSRKSSLKIGNDPSGPPRDAEAPSARQASGPSGFRFAGDQGRAAASSGRMSSTSQDSSAPTLPQFRFDDQRTPLLRRRSGAGLLTLTLSEGKASSENGGAAAPARGFAFTDAVEPLALTGDAPSEIEPTLARNLLTIGTPAPSRALQKTAAVPQVPVSKNPIQGTGGVLVMIRQRTAAASSSDPLPAMSASSDAANEPLRPRQTPPAKMPPAASASGVVNVSAFEPPANSEPMPIRTAEGHRPVTNLESDVASAKAAPVLQKSAEVDAIDETQFNEADASPPAWAQAHEAGPPAPNIEQVPSEWSIPPSPEAPADQAWWTAAQEHTSPDESAEGDPLEASPGADLSACLEVAAAHLLLPVTVMSFEMVHLGESGHSTPAAAASQEPPALLDARANELLQAPLTRSAETPYSRATKPAGAAALPHTETYTMGPARASHPVPHAQPALNADLPGEPLQTSDAEATVTGPAIEVAALLQDLDPLVPGPSRPTGNPEATSPTAADFPSSDPGPADTPVVDPDAGGGASAAEQTLGEAPEETNEPLQFLRRQTVLLEPGEHQFDIGITYLNDTSDFPTLLSEGEDLAVVRAETRQRLLSVPMELRVGIAPYTQAFVNVPFGWSNSEVSFNGSEFTEDEGGIGDVSAGVTKQIVLGNEYYPDVLASLAFSAPTGDSSITNALGTPGSSLGQGFWTLTGSLSFIQTYDPLVFFYGLGYTFRFQNEFGDNIEVEPGDQVFYRFGAGFAVNPHVTLSAAFTGSVLGRDKVDGNEIGGSVREPMSLRLAATISRRKGSKTHSSFKLVEPYVNFGLNDDSIDTLVGVSWTH